MVGRGVNGTLGGTVFANGGVHASERRGRLGLVGRVGIIATLVAATVDGFGMAIVSCLGTAITASP